MKRVKCKSGIEGWQCKLRENYNNDFEEFESYCTSHDIAGRLGFTSPQEAWEINPIIQGSVIPSDLRVVLGEYNKVEFVKEEVEDLFKKLLSGKIKKEQLIGKLNAIENRLKRLFGSPRNQSFWFRLFKGDTMAWDVHKLSIYLELPHYHNNFKHTMECIELAVGSEGIGMECYYS
jgi:hypothetical protein